MMTASLRRLFLCLLIVCSIGSIEMLTYRCDFDFGQKCFLGLSTNSLILLNYTNDQTRLPISDVSAIETSNDDGECSFPYLFGSISMYFCVRTALDLPATCPIKDGNGAKMNCSEGEYGYELFSDGEIGSREYELDLFGSLLHPGDYCLRSFVYFSDLLSNGSIDLLFDYSSSSSSSLNRSVSIQLNSSSILGNRWNELRQDFKLNSLPSKVSFVFRRGISNSNSFSIALDQLTILDQPCQPLPTITTTPEPPINTSITAQTTAIVSTSTSTILTTKTCPTLTTRTTTPQTTASAFTSSMSTTSLPLITTTTTRTVTSTVTSSSANLVFNWTILINWMSIVAALH